MSRRPTAAAVALLLAVGAGALAWAQAPGGRILHEDLPDPTGGTDTPLVGHDPASGANPTAFASGDKILPEPTLGAQGADEPVLGTKDFSADRETETRPDANTGPDGTLTYVSVFNPDVLPFKRMSALDAVRPDYTLYVADRTLVDVAVGGSTEPGRDRFWGSLMIELAPGVDVPLPSVAPDMRVLSYETEPRVALKFSRDGADNFYVRSDEASARGQVRLVFLVDADAGYFAPALPTGRRYTIADVRRAAPAGSLPALPPEVARTALAAAARLGVKPDSELGEAFNRLVYWFRGFQAKGLDTTGDIYLDLFDNQAGVCRHRSFAFIVTATALGLPTRYVTNEAHAFVEVWLPRRGWQRVDLGGAALQMNVSGAEGKTLHRPRAEDPFAKPDAYDQSYTRLQGDIHGLSDGQLAEAREPLGDDASGSWDPLVDGSGGEGPVTDDGALRPGDEPGDAPRPGGTIATALDVTLAGDVGYRGESLTVEGRLTVQGTGHPVGDQRVDIWLAPAGRDGSDAVLVGRTVTRPDGGFTADVDLGVDLELSTYEIYVSTPGDARYAPGQSH